MEKISVLMSVYYKEKPEFLQECLESIFSQSVQPDEIVLVEDGPLTEGLYSVISFNINNKPGLFKIVKLEKNMGLGIALNKGVINCSNDLIARVDSDDISRNDRFEIQAKEFEKDPALELCGSHIIEFENNIENVLSKRMVPLNQKDIIRYQKKRSAFNHMTVFFRKSSVLAAGNYQDALLMEDDYLWVRMLKNGDKCKNIDDFLVYARTGLAMINRRGGLTYFKKYRKGRKKILQTGFITFWDYFITNFIQFFVCILPPKLRQFIFKRLLRS